MFKRLLIAWKLIPNHQTVDQRQLACPVCGNRHALLCHTTYQDIANVTRLPFSSQSCNHIWEVCLQASEGRLLSWTETLEAAPLNIGDAQAQEPWLAEAAEHEGAAFDLDQALETRRRRLQGEDFETWFERAMGNNEAELGL